MTSSGPRGDLESLRLKVLDDVRHGRLAGSKKVVCRNVSQIGMCERYVEGRVQIEVRVASSTKGEEHQLVISRGRRLQVGPQFSAVPPGMDASQGNRQVCRRQSDDQADSMFVGAGNLPQQAEVIVPPLIAFPSWIGFVGLENRVEFRRDVAALVLCYGSVKVVGAASKRKVSPLFFLPHDVMGGGVCNLIKGVPEILDDIRSQSPRLERRGRELELDIIAVGLRIELFDHSCRVFFQKGLEHLFEIIELRCSPCG